MKISLITTTINYPELLVEYAKDIKKFNKEKKNEIIFIIAGDKKTPNKTISLCTTIEKKYEIKTLYLSVLEQNKYLKNYKYLKKYLKWNSVQRRNVAILKALELKSDYIITIDDDNYLYDKNFIYNHINALEKKNGRVIVSKEKWFNVCLLLKERKKQIFYHRGFPVSKRKVNSNYKIINKKGLKVVVNAGLWIGDPDVDAVTRLSNPVESTDYKFKTSLILDLNLWSPFNSQNTAFSSEIAPCYFLSSDVGRMDDIYASYITLRILKHFNYYVSYGRPLVKQNRNDHNIWRDLDLERIHHENLENFLFILDKTKLSKGSNTIFLATEELISKLKIYYRKLKKQNQKIEISKFLNSYTVWLKTLKQTDLF